MNSKPSFILYMWYNNTAINTNTAVMSTYTLHHSVGQSSLAGTYKHLLLGHMMLHVDSRRSAHSRYHSDQTGSL